MTNYFLVAINHGIKLSQLAVLFTLAFEEEVVDKLRYIKIIPEEEEDKVGNKFLCQLQKNPTPLFNFPEIDKNFARGSVDSLDETLAHKVYYVENASGCNSLITGISPQLARPYLYNWNRSIAATLKPEVILVLNVEGLSVEQAADSLMAAANFTFNPQTHQMGFVLVHVKKDRDEYGKAVERIMQKSRPDWFLLLVLDKEVLQVTRLEDLKPLVEKMNIMPLKSGMGMTFDKRMSPALFRVNLLEKAKSVNKKIILPEGAEPRTVQAAVFSAQKKIARLVLLAEEEAVQKTLLDLNLTLPPGIEVIDPKTIADKYVAPLVALRQKKGMTEERAREALKDSVMLGTMMLQEGDVDGLVSGAVHSTAHTILPALQIIKSPPGESLVSSTFFMLFPMEVKLFADCAVNISPTSEQLSELAQQTAATAQAFDIAPKIAFISYSTKGSGGGPEVDKVEKAVELTQQVAPHLQVDGPLQYDAATDISVGLRKAPGSAIAGQANVYIFPDLNTGNTTYKAAQRTGDLVCIGPILQGLRKPVNDLSRGAKVEDIIYTIAATAIQAKQKEQK